MNGGNIIDMIQENDLIHLYKDHSHHYLVKATKQRFHTDKGFIDLEPIIGKEFGQKVVTNLGIDFFVLKPSLYELVMKVNRQTQIIYPKDIGIILTKATIFPGAKIIETGTGSGAFTCALANFIRPEGKVYSYERRKEFFENAERNIIKNGLMQWVELKNKEITDSFDEENADFVMIDIGSPWDLIPAAYRALKPGYKLATICPTFEQLTTTVFCLEENGFTNIETLEVLVRRILVRRGKTRPEQQMPSHTGFIVIASKIILDNA